MPLRLSCRGQDCSYLWLESSVVFLVRKDVKKTSSCGGRTKDERSLKKCFRWWSVAPLSTLSCSSGLCRHLTAGLCSSESCHRRVILRIPQEQPCSVAPQGISQRSHSMNMSLKVYCKSTKEELRTTEVSATSGLCHCKQPSGLPDLCFHHFVRLCPSQSCSPNLFLWTILQFWFSNAKTLNAVLQTTPKWIQKVTLKQEVNLFQNR